MTWNGKLQVMHDESQSHDVNIGCCWAVVFGSRIATETAYHNAVGCVAPSSALVALRSLQGRRAGAALQRAVAVSTR